MKPNAFIVLLAILFALTACGSPATAPVEPTPQATQPPLPSDTPVPPTATLVPSPTPDPLLFRDDFDGSIDEGWNWTNENARTWSLTNNPGWLEIIASPGYVGDSTLDNVLLRPIPEGNFEMETRVNFNPVGDFQLAGLLIYESGANFIQFGRAFCDYPNVCANDGFYVDMVVDSNMDPQNLATAAETDNEIAYLRLRREGNTYTAYASQDGQEWQLIGTKVSDMQPMFIGLLAGQAWSAPQPAQFDYFLVNQLP